jgi:hypothetical protein
MPDKAEVRRRYGLLLVACLASLCVQGVVPPTGVQQVLVSALSGAILLLALRAAQVSRRLVPPVLGLAAVVFGLTLYRVTFGGIDEGAARAMNAGLILFGPPIVAIGIVRELRSSAEVRTEAVMGVLSLYVLLGMFFAFVYGAIDRLGHTFFAHGAEATVAHCLYYSFVTLATVGYGDFAARTDLGHTLSVLEALIGQIYLVTVVSVIVSNLGHPADRSRRVHEER